MPDARSFPPSIDPLMDSLTKELVLINAKWGFFRQLFTTEASTAILNRYAGLAFWFVQETLWDDIILSVCRLADPPKTMNKPNLVLASVVEALRHEGNAELADRIAADLQQYKARIPALIEWRNKRVAHNDLATTLARNSGASILTGVSVDAIGNAIEAAGRMLNLVHGHYRDVDFRFDSVVSSSLSGGDALLFALRKLARYEDNEPDQGRR